MRGLYVYGITAHDTESPGRGIFGRQLRTIRIGPLRAVVEDAARAPKPTLGKLRTQSGVIAALVDNGVDILPARFGTFVSAVELQDLVAERRTDFVRALRAIQGRVQMTVRLKTEEDPRPRPHAGSGGRAYLQAQAKRAQRHTRDPVVRAIQRAARPYARDSRLDWRERRPAIVTLHHLVSRNRIAEYRQAVLRVVRDAGTDAIVSGPWAPFAFAEVA